jgi:hypothetical protein
MRNSGFRQARFFGKLRLRQSGLLSQFLQPSPKRSTIHFNSNNLE